MESKLTCAIQRVVGRRDMGLALSLVQRVLYALLVNHWVACKLVDFKQIAGEEGIFLYHVRVRLLRARRVLRRLVGAKITCLWNSLDGLVLPLDAELHFGEAHLSGAFILIDTHVVNLVIVNGLCRHAFFSSLIRLGRVCCSCAPSTLLAWKTSLLF